MKNALEIKDLHKVYKNGTYALKGLSLEIKQGEFFALLGPNGSGKTTMINILSGPTKKTSGDVKVMGMNIEEFRQETKMLLGVVPQELSADSFFTVNETLNLQSGYYGIRNNQKYIDEILEKLSLKDKKHANTRALSGGMKRRLEVARGLIHRPRVLFLDEPTLGLDPQSRTKLWEFIAELTEKHNVTIFMTTHYMEEAEVCDRIAIIDNGKIIAAGTPDELKKAIGGDVIYIKTTDNASAKKEIERLLKFGVSEKDSELFMTCAMGDTCIPEVIRTIGEKDKIF